MILPPTALLLMGQGESSFYPVHGHNVYLRENGSFIERATDSRSHAIAFTKKPLVLNGLFQIKILHKNEKKKKNVTTQVVIGITTQNPATIRNLSSCSSLYELQHGSVGDRNSDYWCVEFTSSIKSNSVNNNYRQVKREIPLTENDTVGLMLTKSGYVHMLVNGIDQEVLWNNLPTHLPLWGVLELTGVVTCVRAEYKNISSLTLHEDESRVSPTPNRPLPPIPFDSNILVTTLPQRSPSPKPPDPPPRSPTSLRKQSSPLPPSLSPSPNPIHRAKTTLTLPHKQHSLDHNVTLGGVFSRTEAALQQTIHEQTQQIIRLERERDEQRDEKDDLQQQIDILRMQLVQRQKAPTPDTSLAPPTITPTPENDDSFWEISCQDIQIGETILGRGGWGEVREGTFRGTKVAIKKLYSEISSPHYVSLVKREISMMAKVRHPNLVLFIAAVLDDSSGIPMIVLELLGKSLRHAYQHKELDLLIKINILHDVCCALNYLHQHKEEIIHRDVSSANVLLEEMAGGNYKAKLSDFGSANLARLSITAVPGAEVYTAPEVTRNTLHSDGSVLQTTKIDVYSFGVLTCELIAGTFPMRDIFHDMLSNVSQQSLAIKQLIDSCVELDPYDRPNMSYVLVALNELL